LSSPSIAAITVTYNSQRFFRKYMESLRDQVRPLDRVVLVDSGSTDPQYLDQACSYGVRVEVIRKENVGICVGNNIGWQAVRNCDYVLFLNPDAFLAPDFVKNSVEYMVQNPKVGMLMPTLLGYSIERDEPTGLIDTTGVVRSWYGGLPERDQYKPVSELEKYPAPNEIPWVCSAVALARREALESIEVNGDVFDPAFFMYKDDTDLSWRVRRAGWKLIHHPGLWAYHCRGWKSRKLVSKKVKLLSARNEVRLHIKNRSPFLIAACIKYALVQCLNV
jgi:N-acetylglucosaminyl-diphospho-decaprenol L-rhamnosyltransferase